MQKWIVDHIYDLLLGFFRCQERGRRGHDCMVVGFTTNCVISAYLQLSCEFESR
jgi:hypothetical protein